MMEGVEYVRTDLHAEAVEALRTYGRHLSTCDVPTRGLVNGAVCDCGWDAVDPNRAGGR